MAGDSGKQPGDPTAPGWYPDPWSATGDGERYFDGKRWGSTEKPLARHTVATREEGPPKPDRVRRVFLPVAILVVLVAAVWAVPKFLTNDSSDEATSTGSRRSQNAPPPSTEEAAQPLGTPAPVPAGTGRYEIIQFQPGDTNTPVAFDPCRPVHYVVNPAGAPADGLAMVQDAVASVSTATGLKFVYDGTTTETPSKDRAPYLPSRYKDRWSPDLIAWSDEATVPDLAGYIAGFTTPQPVEAPSGRLVYVTGQVILDGQQLAEDQVSDRTQAKAVVLHELGHLVGLDHTNDQTQIMFSESKPEVQAYGDGDLRGLALLGRQACFPNV